MYEGQAQAIYYGYDKPPNNKQKWTLTVSQEYPWRYDAEWTTKRGSYIGWGNIPHFYWGA